MAEVKETNSVQYTDELAEYFASINQTKPRSGWSKTEIDENGFWVRQPNYLITPFGDKDGQNKVIKDRYVIYWHPGCNWSNRPVIARDLLGLHDEIKDYIVEPTGESNKYGWGFGKEANFKDPYTDAYFLSDLYTNVDSSYKGRATTPTIVDFIQKKALNNDYHRLTNYLEVQFRKFQPLDAPDLYPVKYRKEIDEFNDWLFPNINDGHYRQAFATSPEGYRDGHDAFHDALEKLDKRLADNRFLFGDYITDSDIRAFVSLVKWESGVYLLAGPQKKRIREYKNVWEYVKELFQVPAFRDNTLPYLITSKEKPNELKFGQNYLSRIGTTIDWQEYFKSDGARKALSEDSEHIFLKHPAGETVSDYQTDISSTKWNDLSQETRAEKNFILSTNPEVNPLKGLLKNY